MEGVPREIDKLIFNFKRNNPYSPYPKYLILSNKKRSQLHDDLSQSVIQVTRKDPDNKPSEFMGLTICLLDGGYDSDIMEVR